MAKKKKSKNWNNLLSCSYLKRRLEEIYIELSYLRNDIVGMEDNDKLFQIIDDFDYTIRTFENLCELIAKAKPLRSN